MFAVRLHLPSEHSSGHWLLGTLPAFVTLCHQVVALSYLRTI